MKKINLIWFLRSSGVIIWDDTLSCLNVRDEESGSLKAGEVWWNLRGFLYEKWDEMIFLPHLYWDFFKQDEVTRQNEMVSALPFSTWNCFSSSITFLFPLPVEIVDKTTLVNSIFRPSSSFSVLFVKISFVKSKTASEKQIAIQMVVLFS